MSSLSGNPDTHRVVPIGAEKLRTPSWKNRHCGGPGPAALRAERVADSPGTGPVLAGVPPYVTRIRAVRETTPDHMRQSGTLRPVLSVCWSASPGGEL